MFPATRCELTESLLTGFTRFLSAGLWTCKLGPVQATQTLQVLVRTVELRSLVSELLHVKCSYWLFEYVLISVCLRKKKRMHTRLGVCGTTHVKSLQLGSDVADEST